MGGICGMSITINREMDEGNVLFNDALNTIYGYMASDIC